MAKQAASVRPAPAVVTEGLRSVSTRALLLFFSWDAWSCRDDELGLRCGQSGWPAIDNVQRPQPFDRLFHPVARTEGSEPHTVTGPVSRSNRRQVFRGRLRRPRTSTLPLKLRGIGTCRLQLYPYT